MQAKLETPTAEKNRAVRILAKSIYKDLVQQGYDERQIVTLATELISEVTASISSREQPAPVARPQARG
jgi:hypothetical protein